MSGDGKTTFHEKNVLNWMRGTTFPVFTGTLYLAAFSVAPTDAYTIGSPNGTEWTGNAYARQLFTLTAPSGTPSASSNVADILFPIQTPGGNGALAAVGVFDAVTGGNLLYWKAASGTVYAANDQLKFVAGTFTITEE